jgi:hypothetical protein
MKMMPENHVQEHIALIAKHEQEFLSKGLLPNGSVTELHPPSEV